ncbi:uncharacterized protein DNG_04238 [Cephalotrichum gorgonifer]|uniref:DUF985 domain-containing protein n=1 Tax=Cephalotrichum gorgonifer TaxID=2041049 RepID=A0AAE8MVQ3_9PEZI|nr:uncharacterized protein DNG_04238 [Cephalotrichum gorgonifer]
MILIPYLVSVVPLLEVALAFTTPHQFPRDRDCTAMNDRTAEEVIAHLNLIPNTPEKGYFAETFRDDDSDPATNRSRSTAIYYLLEGSAGHSVWHRLDAAEVWHYYAGAPLTLSVWSGEEITEVVLGPDVFRDEKPQAVVKKGEWQSARSEGDWTLVGTTVAPGFDPAGAEFADPEWTPQSQKSS